VSEPAKLVSVPSEPEQVARQMRPASKFAIQPDEVASLDELEAVEVVVARPVAMQPRWICLCVGALIPIVLHYSQQKTQTRLRWCPVLVRFGPGRPADPASGGSGQSAPRWSLGPGQPGWPPQHWPSDRPRSLLSRCSEQVHPPRPTETQRHPDE